MKAAAILSAVLLLLLVGWTRCRAVTEGYEEVQFTS